MKNGLVYFLSRECYGDFIYVLRAVLETKEKWQSRLHPYLPGKLRSVSSYCPVLQVTHLRLLKETNALFS